MTTYFRSVLIIAIFLIASCKEKSLTFSKLDQFSKIDTVNSNGKVVMFKTDYYLVYNYKDNLKNERTVDSFAYKNRAKDLALYDDYLLVVYKTSDITNEDNLKKNPKDFEIYSLQNDMIYQYSWSKGKWSGKSKFRNYELVEAQEMIRED